MSPGSVVSLGTGVISAELRRSCTRGRSRTGSLIPRARRRLERLHHVADLEHDLHEFGLSLHLLRRKIRWWHRELLENRPRARREHVRPITEVDRFLDGVRDEKDRRLRLTRER